MEPLDRLIAIDRTSPVPLYFQVARRLQDLIESGELAPGTRLDNEIALADQLGLSRPTVRQAMQHLVDKGLLARKRGVGTQVVHNRVRRQVELTSLYDDLERAGRRPRTDVLSCQLVPAPSEVAAALAVEVGAEVLAVRRLRYAGDEPLAIMQNHLRSDSGVTAAGLAERGLYRLLRAAGTDIRLADQAIGARKATAAEAVLLHEPRGATLLTLQRTAYDSASRPVEYAYHLYRASLYSFEMTVMTR
jgi:DNA-binding GntR family transcriptional regulator